MQEERTSRGAPDRHLHEPHGAHHVVEARMELLHHDANSNMQHDERHNQEGKDAESVDILKWGWVRVEELHPSHSHLQPPPTTAQIGGEHCQGVEGISNLSSQRGLLQGQSKGRHDSADGRDGVTKGSSGGQGPCRTSSGGGQERVLGRALLVPAAYECRQAAARLAQAQFFAARCPFRPQVP